MSHTKTGFSLLLCKRPACHMPILWIRTNTRESNSVKCLEGQYFLVGQVEASRVGGWCIVVKGGHPWSCIVLALICCVHADMRFSFWSHVDTVRWRYCVNILSRKSELPQGNLILWLAQLESTRQRYRNNFKLVVTLALFYNEKDHHLKTNSFRQTLWNMWQN